MTYDALDGHVVLLGATGFGPLNGTETWTYSTGSWTRIYPSQSPESCYGSSLAYDHADQYVVYFAGGNIGGGNCSSAGQTWTYRSGHWTELFPTVSPSPRLAAAFTNDSADGYLLLFGGVNNSCANSSVCNDTWKFVGGVWTQLFPTTVPPARAGAGLSYDARDGYVLMFGGTADVPSLTNRYFWVTMLNDTWSFRNGTWTQLTPVGTVPPEPYDDGMVYMASDRAILYTCADNNLSSEPELFWGFQGGNWTDYNRRGINSSDPPNRLAEALAYDWKDGYAVMFGGTATSWNRLADTWSYRNGTWTNLTGRAPFSANLSVSPSTTDVGRPTNFSTSVFAASGSYSYAYFGLPPGCASLDGPSFTCSPSTTGSYVVMVAVRNSTGHYSNSSAPLTVNPIVGVAAFTARPESVALGRSTNLSVFVSGGTPPVAFAFSNLPPGCLTAPTPVLSCTPSGFGVFQVVVNVSDSVGGFASATITLTVTASFPAPPMIQAFAVIPSEVTVGSSATLFVVANGVGSLTLDYGGLPPGCLSFNLTPISCTPSQTGLFVAEARVTDAFGQRAFANATLTVLPAGTAARAPLSIQDFGASPSVISLGETTVLVVTTYGGAPPYGYAYSGLPLGCVSDSDPSVICTPRAAGNYSVGVTVTDSGSNTSQSTTILVVMGASGSTPSGLSPAGSGPTWLDFGLGVLSVGLAVALVMMALGRGRLGRGPGS